MLVSSQIPKLVKMLKVLFFGLFIFRKHFKIATIWYQKNLRKCSEVMASQSQNHKKTANIVSAQLHLGYHHKPIKSDDLSNINTKHYQ